MILDYIAIILTGIVIGKAIVFVCEVVIDNLIDRYVK